MCVGRPALFVPRPADFCVRGVRRVRHQRAGSRTAAAASPEVNHDVRRGVSTMRGRTCRARAPRYRCRRRDRGLRTTHHGSCFPRCGAELARHQPAARRVHRSPAKPPACIATESVHARRASSSRSRRPPPADTQRRDDHAQLGRRARAQYATTSSSTGAWNHRPSSASIAPPSSCHGPRRLSDLFSDGVHHRNRFMRFHRPCARCSTWSSRETPGERPHSVTASAVRPRRPREAIFAAVGDRRSTQIDWAHCGNGKLASEAFVLVLDRLCVHGVSGSTPRSARPHPPPRRSVPCARLKCRGYEVEKRRSRTRSAGAVAVAHVREPSAPSRPAQRK